MSGDASTSLLQPGSRLGSCELLCVLARGGTSIVWLARNKGLGGFEKLVAVKTIQPEHAGNAKFQKLLLEEARISAELHDVHVVQVLDLGLLGDIGYIVMEHIDGESLRALLHVLAKRKKLMPIPIALRIVVDICTGLAAAHGLARSDGRPNGIIHRDVSPENVLLTTAGKACLIDFGFAIDEDSDASHVGTVGKPGFLAPEVAEGAPADARSDIWSAGSILYNLLAGRAPYEGKRPLAAMNALLARDPIAPLPNEVPEPVRGVVSQALQHDPEQRFTRAVAMRKALENAGASTCGIASSPDVATFVERILADRIKGRRKAVERALQEAERREKVFESLMAPPEILAAGEVMTPWRQSEARLRAAEAAAVPSSRGEDIALGAAAAAASADEPETLLKNAKHTLRPEPEAFAMSMAPDTWREPAPTNRTGASNPKPGAAQAVLFTESSSAAMPQIPKLAPPPSSSKFRAADLLASTAPERNPKSSERPPLSADVETVPLAPPLVVAMKTSTTDPPPPLVPPAVVPAAPGSDPALAAPINGTPPPLLSVLGASANMPVRGDRTLPMMSQSPFAPSAPPAASAAPAPPETSHPPPLAADGTNPPPVAPTYESSSPSQSHESTSSSNSASSSKRLYVLLALPGLLALIAVAVVIFLRARAADPRGIAPTSDSASASSTASTASTAAGSSAPLGSTSVAPVASASNAPTSPSAAPSASASSHVAAAASSVKGKGKGPHKTPRTNPSAASATTVAPAPPPPPPED